MVQGESDEDILFKKGSDLVKNQKYNEALKVFGEIVAMNPLNEKAWIARGVTLNYQMKYRDAELAFDQVLKINPNNQTAIHNRDMVRRFINPSDPIQPSIPTVLKKKPKRQLKKWEKIAILLVAAIWTIIWPNILSGIWLIIIFIGIIYVVAWTDDPVPLT